MYQDFHVSEKNKNIGAEMLRKIAERHGKGGHPRLIYTPEILAFLREHRNADDAYGKTVDVVIKQADAFLTEKPRIYELRDNLRLLYVSHEVLDIIFYCGSAYLITGEKKYCDRGLTELDAILHFPDWNPYHDLDCGVLAFAFGVAFDWFYHDMTEEYRAFAVEGARKFVFHRVVDDYENRTHTHYQPGVCERPDNELARTYLWVQHTPGDNHKLITGAGTAVAALAVCDESAEVAAEAEKLLTYSYDLDEKFLAAAYDPRDGSYFEGVDYWEYGMRHFALHMTALNTACGTTFDILNQEGFRKTAYFPPMLSSNNGKMFCNGDGTESFTNYPPYLWLGRQFGISGVAKLRYDRISEKGGNVWDLMWLCPAMEYSSAGMPTDYGAVGVTNATFRTSWEDGALFIGMHCGKNDVPHGHMDMGTFVVDYGNERFFGDLGKDDYNIVKYRQCYRFRAEGHNCLVFNPSAEDDQDYFNAEAYMKTFVPGEMAEASADISSAYPGKTVVRSISLDKKHSIGCIHDSVSCESSDVLYWFGQTKAEIALSADKKTAVLTSNGVSLLVTSQGDGYFDEMPAAPASWSPDSPGQASTEGYRKLAIRLTGKDHYEISVTVAPKL